MTDATRPAPGDPPQGAPRVSEEEAREYARQLRPAPAEQIVMEILSGLLNAAQVKLGRRDGRLLIDLCAVMLEHVRPHLPADLTRQVDYVLGQLRLAQVRAEEAAGQGSKPEPNDLAETPAPPAGAAGQPPASAPQPAAQPHPAPQPSPASRLWLPGRDF